mmetsp:Transcript_39780/g.112874  ORF Transcript_39780/g.112874 Transcript_39780/m.112874 type:complete len:539 (-) Transcript_39780:164-1780(-)
MGHTQEAYQALEEAVRIGQQASDNGILVHSLAALCRLCMVCKPQNNRLAVGQVALPRGDRPEAAPTSNALPGEPPAATHLRVLLHLLHRCLARAQELKLPHLVAYARLAIAQVQLQRGFGSGMAATSPAGVDPHRAVNREVSVAVQEAEELRHLSSLAVAALVGPPREAGAQPAGQPPAVRSLTEIFPSTQGLLSGPAGAKQAAAAVAQLAGEAHLLAASAWAIHGYPVLAACQGILHAGCFGAAASSADTATGMAGLVETATCSSGREAGLCVLEVARGMLPAGHRHLSVAALAVDCHAATSMGDAHKLKVLSATLASMAQPGAGPESQVWLKARMAWLESIVLVGDHLRAAEAARRLFNQCLSSGLQVPCTQLLGFIGRAHLAAGSCATALPYLLTCMAHCEALGMDLELADATVNLAEAWCQLGCPHVPGAVKLLRDVLPLVLGRGGAELRARAQLAMARAMLLLAERNDVVSESQSVLRLLNSSSQTYSQIQCWPKAAEAHYLAALVADSAGLQARRDSEAEAWQRCLSRQGTP